MEPAPYPPNSELTRDRSEAEFRRLLENLPTAAYTCDADGLITFYNRHAVEAWGRAPLLNDPRDRFCGSFKLFLPDGTAVNHQDCYMALAMRENREYLNCEVIIERPNGQRTIVLANVNPLHDEYGVVTGAVNLLVDISERKRNEELLLQTDRRRSDFLAMLSHELRNPLAPIRNALHIMRVAKDNPAMMDQARHIMERQMVQMVRLIDDLLDLSRITKGKVELRKERMDICSSVQDALEISRPMIDEQGHQLTIELPAKPVYVEGDRTRLTQVFSNLLNNSAKYTEAGGRVSLVVEHQGSDVVVKVKDNGVGISPEMLPRIFDLFTQVDQAGERSRGGLGIGLSLVRALVELHGGQVEVYSDGLGKGSEFIVRLSALLPAASGRADGRHVIPPPSTKHRILVVDDNQDSAATLSIMMRILGHETHSVYDGLAAVEAVKTFGPDVVLLDIGLPKLNGYDACRRIRELPHGERIVLIAITGWGQEEDKARSKEAGFNFHMVKPVDASALEKLLAGLLLIPA